VLCPVASDGMLGLFCMAGWVWRGVVPTGLLLWSPRFYPCMLSFAVTSLPDCSPINHSTEGGRFLEFRPWNSALSGSRNVQQQAALLYAPIRAGGQLGALCSCPISHAVGCVMMRLQKMVWICSQHVENDGCTMGCCVVQHGVLAPFTRKSAAPARLTKYGEKVVQWWSSY
jgi:hypothetical protein